MTRLAPVRRLPSASRAILAAAALAGALCGAGPLGAKPDVTLGATLGWLEKHRADFRAEWHTSEGPTRWQPEDFKNFSGTRNVFWDVTVKWTVRSDGPQFGKALNQDGETYSIARSETLTGEETDLSERDEYKDAHYTRQIWASYAWRFKVSQVRPEPIVIEYKEYLKRTNQVDNQSVDAGTYYYVCILSKEGADPDAIIEIGNDEKLDDGRGNVTTTKGYRDKVAIAGIATVQDKRMAERLARTVGHLISLLQSAKASPKKDEEEPF